MNYFYVFQQWFSVSIKNWSDSLSKDPFSIIFNSFASLCSVVGLFLTIFILIKVLSSLNSKKFLEKAKLANTIEHKYKESGLAMKIDVNATSIEVIASLRETLAYYQSIANKMDKTIDSKILWEERVLGLNNHSRRLSLLILQLEIQILELEYLTRTFPLPRDFALIEKKREEFIELAKTSTHID